jgi:3-methyladenine DNA glycosylase AlkD
MLISAIQVELDSLSDPGRAANLQRYFKTGPGQYGEGDRFRGLRVPVVRQIARKYRRLSLAETEQLLHSLFHEDRLLALLILIHRYYAGDDAGREAIHRFYLEHRARVNNWDLVDASAPHLVGHFLHDRDRGLLPRLAASEVLWERRMAIIATLYFIKQGDFDDTLTIAGLLLRDPEDLIHKAVGWMLREVGKARPAVAEAFCRPITAPCPAPCCAMLLSGFPRPGARHTSKAWWPEPESAA